MDKSYASHVATFDKVTFTERSAKTYANSFKQKYPRARAIIDCTEIFVERPCNTKALSTTYSAYKSHHTAKLLVGIDPTDISRK